MNINKRKFKNVDGASCSVALVCGALLLLSAGCKQEKTKTIPPDRLTVEWGCPTNAIHVGDPVELTVTTYFPSHGTLELPELGREKDIVLLNRNWNHELREDGLTKTETIFTLTSFRLGEHMVSTGTISCRVDDKTFIANFPSIALTVESALTDSSSEIADIKPMQKLPGRIPRWIWIVLGTAATAFLVGLISSKLWKHRETLVPSAPPTPPHVLALKALEKLKGKGLLERDECNPFYTELSLILRAYLEGRFNLNATDETTEEIVEEMSKSPDLNGSQRNILQEFMRQADMVKFAKGHPDRLTMESAFKTTQHFVEETKQPEGSAAK